MALPIRQTLNALPGLGRTLKAVLIEVCELADNGSKGHCDASNRYLAERLAASVPTITRAVTSLEERGLIGKRIVAAEANRRYLSPAPEVRACYAGNKAEQAASFAALSERLTIVISDTTPNLTIVTLDADYSHSEQVTIVSLDSDYSQNASRVLGDDHDDQLTTNYDHEITRLTAALATAEGRITELTEKLATAETKTTALTAELEQARATIDDYVNRPKRSKKDPKPDKPHPQAGCQATIDAYYAWYRGLTGGSDPVPTGQDFAALKTIHATFRKRLGEEAPEADVGAAFAELLSIWPRLSGWQQGRKAPREIAADLTNLIATHAQLTNPPTEARIIPINGTQHGSFYQPRQQHSNPAASIDYAAVGAGIASLL